MVGTLYRDTTYSVSLLVDTISRGEIALPDIQRPFVWPAAKVRDLFDSMYKGFPVGYLLLWETGAEAGARQIGTDVKQGVPRLLIVDGQQRLTSLFAVMTGAEVVRDDYTSTRIRIAFRPTDAVFAVTDAAVEKDPEFLSDISELWRPQARKTVVRAFLRRLATKRLLEQAEQDRLEDAIDRLFDLQHYPFTVVELSSAADEEQVAEVFVRINSEGVTLNQADFILTLMSVFWDSGRRQLEAFCRDCKVPSLSAASPFNWFLQPQPPQLLRATIAVAFRRAVLKHAYTLLRGRAVETGQPDPTRRDTQFACLATAQEQVLNLTYWHEYLRCLERAGFRGARMISSENAIIYSYALWLIGRLDYRVPIDRLREIIAAWFFMAHTTSRYSGSFESQVERDLGVLAGIAAGDGDGFVRALNAVINDTLTTDYWTIRLPDNLSTSAAKSPALLAYLAALNILDADALLSTGTVRTLLDPAVTARKGIERHHLFPRAYLRSIGICDTKQINQIANMALVEWHDNITIADQAPAKYWPAQLAAKHLPETVVAAHQHWHALPEDWTILPYPQFLAARRRLMAAVTCEAFQRLTDTGYRPVYPASGMPIPDSAGTVRASYSVRMTDLLDAGILNPDTVLINPGDNVEATVFADGQIAFDGTIYDSLSGAGNAAHGGCVNGWTYWHADTPTGLQRLATLRQELRSADESATDTSDQQK